MDAEKLLQFLLDSRVQPSISPPARESYPTRIRVLQALQWGSFCIPDLAEEVNVTRQTGYRAVTPLENAGLVRKRADYFTLTCSGSRVLQAFSDVDEEITVESLARLARSPHQQWLLQTLEQESMRKCTLVERAQNERGPSRTTIHRILTRLQKDGSITCRSNTYELSNEGELLYDSFEHLRKIAAEAIESQSFLRWLPAALSSLPFESFEDSVLIHNTPDQPHNVLNAFVTGLKRDLRTFRGIGAIRSPALDQAYRPVMNQASNAEIIFTDEILFQFHSDHQFVNYAAQDDYSRYLEDGFIRNNARLLFVPKSVPLQLVIYDDSRVIMAPAPSTGVLVAESTALDSSDSQIIKWAVELFNEYVKFARPPIRVFQEHTPSSIGGEQSYEPQLRSSIPQTKAR